MNHPADKAQAERRLRRYRLNSDCLAQYLNKVALWPSAIGYCVPQNLPADAHCLDAYYCQESRTWFVIVASEEFPVVPAGERIPSRADEVATRTHFLLRGRDGAWREQADHVAHMEAVDNRGPKIRKALDVLAGYGTIGQDGQAALAYLREQLLTTPAPQ